MPEGDTIHNLATVLRPLLVGRHIRASRLHGRADDPLGGGTVAAIESLGKHLFIRLDDGRTLRSHLGLYGSWHSYGPDEPWQKPPRHASVVLRLDDRVLVCFHAREVELLHQPTVERRELAKRLGPDLTGPSDAEAIVARARARLPPATPLLDVLLDQQVACGIGNVYKCELLFLERQPPLRRLEAVTDAALAALYRRAAELLRRNLGSGPRTTRFVADDGPRLWVYGRRDAPCLLCGAAIRYGKLGRDVRGTYWCPQCQAQDQTAGGR